MRILIYLLLGGLVLGVVVYSLRLLRGASSDIEGGGSNRERPFPLPEGRWGWLFFLGVVVLFLLMLVERVPIGSDSPNDLAAPPAVNSQGASGRYY